MMKTIIITLKIATKRRKAHFLMAAGPNSCPRQPRSRVNKLRTDLGKGKLLYKNKLSNI